ncbi:hypothetical protein WDU94_011950 [Cyamophila willieti]
MLINESDLFTWETIGSKLFQRSVIPNPNEVYTVPVVGENENTTEVVVRVIVENIEPFCTIKEAKNGSISISGYMADIWAILEKSLNFRSEYVLANFEVGVHMLMNGTADVRLVPVIVTTADNEDFDFTLPVAQNWYELFTRSDDDGASSLSYIVTWSDKLWFAFAGTCLFLSLITYSMLYLRYKYRLEKLDDETVDPATVSPGENKTELLKKQKYTNISLGNCFLNVLGSFTSQGCECPSLSYQSGWLS